MEPTGEAVDMQGMNFLHIENGKIAEDWVLWDSLGMMQQLGIGPEPPAP
jgi:predicted ester cyclase